MFYHLPCYVRKLELFFADKWVFYNSKLGFEAVLLEDNAIIPRFRYSGNPYVAKNNIKIIKKKVIYTTII